MNLKDQLKVELDRRYAAGQRRDQRISVSQSALRLDVDVEAIETLGCSVRSLSVETANLADATIDELKQISETLTATSFGGSERIIAAESQHIPGQVFVGVNNEHGS